ncbi:MAG: hypothetical protein J6F31_04005 [Oscillospiraceae bacterium]|nr:hypothetical protein [Oscillospiraceae bacterium]
MYSIMNDTAVAGVRKSTCTVCGQELTCPAGTAANRIYICPRCKSFTADCEYGYAAITPCDIFLGTDKIGEITQIRVENNIRYRLSSASCGICRDLSEGYADLGAYREAVSLLTDAVSKAAMPH